MCIKNGKALFGQTQALNIILWVLVMLLLSVLCVYGFVAWQWYFSVRIFSRWHSENYWSKFVECLLSFANRLRPINRVIIFTGWKKRQLSSTKEKIFPFKFGLVASIVLLTPAILSNFSNTLIDFRKRRTCFVVEQIKRRLTAKIEKSIKR